jgi:hypothetical protein
VRRAAAAALLALLYYGTFAFLECRKRHFDLSALVKAGDVFTLPREAPPGLTVERNSSGYDGQFYYRMALHPLSREARVGGIRFDFPVYRSQRIGYPLLIHVLSGGNSRAVPWVMLIVNVIALAVIAGIAATITNRVLVGLTVALYPGFLLTLSRDLVEALEMCLVLGALYLVLRRRYWGAAVLLTGAVLTKETVLLFVIAAAVTNRRHALHFALPVAAWVGWKLFLFRWWHLPIRFFSGEDFTLPFVGLARRFHDVPPLAMIEIALLVVFALIVALALRTSASSFVVKVGWLFYAALLFTLGSEFWWEDWSFLRAATGYGVFGTLIAAESPRWSMVMSALVGCSSLALAVRLLWSG